MARERILLVDDDLHNLSRIYLALIHRNYKVEACDKPDEISARIKRFKPLLIILNSLEYESIKKKLKIPAIVIEKANTDAIKLNDGDVQLRKPVEISTLIKAVRKLV